MLSCGYISQGIDLNRSSMINTYVKIETVKQYGDVKSANVDLYSRYCENPLYRFIGGYLDDNNGITNLQKCDAILRYSK